MKRTHEQNSFLNFGRLVERFRQSPTRWVMLITFIGMVFSLIFHVLIPKLLGASETADALIATLKVVLLVDTVLREGTKFSIVPLFIQEEQSRSKIEFERFTSSILNFSICVGIGLMLVIEVFATLIANFLLSDSSVAARAEMVTFLRLCAPLVIFGSGSTILGAFLNSQRHFKTVAFRNALPPGIATVVFILLSGTEDIANSVAMAYACGFIVYFIWLSIGLYRTGYGYHFSWVSFEALRSLKNTITLPTLGFTIRQMTARLFVEVFLVGKLGKGAITLYNSAFRIFSAIQTLIGISIATTGLPDMAADNSDENKLKLRQNLLRNLRTVLYIAVPVTLALLLGSNRIAQFLYGNGELEDQSVLKIGQILFYLSIGTVFSCLIPVLNAGLYAQKAYGLILRNMITMAILNFIIAYISLLVWGLRGIAFAVVVTAVLAVVNLVFLLSKTGVTLFSKG